MFNNKKIKEQEELIDGLRKERSKFMNKYYDEELKVEKLRDRIEVLEEQNKELIDWIKTIIKEVGCYEVKDKNEFRIPIYKNEGFEYWYDNSKGVEERLKTEITIPKITISKVTFRKEKV